MAATSPVRNVGRNPMEEAARETIVDGGDGVRGTLLHGVGDADHPGSLLADRDQHRGLALIGDPVPRGQERRRVDTGTGQQPLVAHQNGTTCHGGPHPLAGERVDDEQDLGRLRDFYAAKRALYPHKAGDIRFRQ